MENKAEERQLSERAKKLHAMSVTREQLKEERQTVEENLLPDNFKSFGQIANEKFGYKVWNDVEFYTYEEAAKEYALLAIKTLLQPARDAEIKRLREALEQIVECTGTSTLQNKIAREALKERNEK